MSDEFKDEGNLEDQDVGFEDDPEKKLTNWANEPSLSDLKTDLEESQPTHKAHIHDVEAWRKMYNGEVNWVTKANRSKVVPKTIRKQAEWRYTALSEPFLSSDNIFEVEPITWEDKERAEQNQLVLNDQMNNRIDKISFIDEYIRTAVDEGTVIVKVGWVAKEGNVTVDKKIYEYLPPADEEHMQQLGQEETELHQLMQYAPLDYERQEEHVKKAHELFMEHGVPFQPVHVRTERVTKKAFLQNHPTVEVCAYDHIIIDPTAKGVMKDAQFVIHDFESTLSDLRKDGRYHNLDKINAKNVLEDADTAAGEETETFKFKDKPRQKLTVYEYHGYWDIDGNGETKPILSAWVGDVMVRLEENPFPDEELPFVLVKYMPIANETYGEPDGALLADNQQIIGAVTRGMIDIMGRSAAGQQGTRKDALDVTNRRRFEDGDDYQFNANIDPRQAFQMGEFPDIPNSALEMINLQNGEAEAITGVKSFSNGISGAALGSTATAVRGALDAASKRELGILRRLAAGITEVGRKFISMNAEFLDEDEIIRITNDEFVSVRRDDLAGRFDIRLSISTAESDNAKAEELSFMLQTGASTQDPEEVRMIRAEIAKLRKMPKLAKQIEEYRPQPDPIAQENAVLQNKLIEAQIRELDSKANENVVDADVKGAKVGTEQAKARQMHSAADKQDLDFLEQKDGVSHNRDMDKQDGKNAGSVEVAAVNAASAQLTAEKGTNSTETGDNVTSLLKNFNL